MYGQGRQLLQWVHHAAFKYGFQVTVDGELPNNRSEQIIVAANHQSHLDYGVIKYALKGRCAPLSALAAADYFFDRSWKKRVLLPLTDLIPVMRQGHLSLALKGAESALSDGRSILIFPEGTRSIGEIQRFRPGVGYLQKKSGLSILPLYISGTQQILPRGSAMPKGRNIRIRVGSLMTNRDCQKLCRNLTDPNAFRAIADGVQSKIKALEPDASTMPSQK